MDQFLARIPKTTLALLAIVIGFVVIVLSDPPKTACGSQLELFQREQADFLYAGTTGSTSSLKRALAKQLFDECKSGNSPGGCFEFFVRLKKLNQDLDSVPRQCAETMAGDDTLKAWVLNSMKLMSQISWGDRGPASIARRNAWFDSSDLSLFCGLKKNASQMYGADKVDDWREGVLASLPEAEKLDREQLFQKSLFATPCEMYR